MDTYLKDFLHKHEIQINNNDFEQLYLEIKNDPDCKIIARQLTDVLVSSGINPLRYMNYVPERFATSSRISMKHFIIPNNIKTVRSMAFVGCDFDHIQLPEGLENIFNSAFSRCRELKSIYLPSTLKFIGDFILSGCSSLQKIEYGGSEDDFKKIYRTSTKWQCTDINDFIDVTYLK